MRHAIHLILLAALAASAVPAHAQPTDATALSGQWRGTYVCSQGETALELALRGNAHGVVRGVFSFSAMPQNPDVPSGSYPVVGRLTGTSLVLRPIDVRDMPGVYVPVGIQATVAQGSARMGGLIEGPACGVVTLRRTAAAAPTDSLYGGYGGQWWKGVAEFPEGALFVDNRRLLESSGSTARLWVRWEVVDDGPSSDLQPGQALEWEREFECQAGLVRTWHTLVYAADRQLQLVDSSAPYRWMPVEPGTLDELAFQYSCPGASLPQS